MFLQFLISNYGWVIVVGHNFCPCFDRLTVEFPTWLHHKNHLFAGAAQEGDGAGGEEDCALPEDHRVVRIQVNRCHARVDANIFETLLRYLFSEIFNPFS